MVSEGIDYASLSETVGLIRDSEHLACSCGNRAGLRNIGVIDMQRDANGRASDSLRTRCPEVGRLRRHPDALPVDEEQRDLRPVRRNHPLPFFRGTESLSIERDSSIYVFDREKRMNLRHAPTLPTRLRRHSPHVFAAAREVASA